MAKAGNIVCKPLTPETWPDLERLFGATGACAGCWCMYWRLSRPQFDRGKGEPNRNALRALVDSGIEPGVLAYKDGQPVGWCAIEPRDSFPRLDRSRVLERIDAEPVWSVVCFFVAKPHRRTGVGKALLDGAVRLARSKGAHIIEGYPIDPGRRYPDTFAWTGLASIFEQAGFREVARHSPTRPMMRKMV